jgi:Reverse transcriptase (RNA-dependent DNA polymerase)
VDAIVRELKNQGYTDDDTILFYADDGLIAGTGKEKIQQLLTTITDLFYRIGLKMNTGKTKALISQPTIPNHRICTPAFNRRKSGEGLSYLSDNRTLINCTVCGLELQRRSYKRHMTSQHNNDNDPKKDHKPPTYSTDQAGPTEVN